MAHWGVPWIVTRFDRASYLLIERHVKRHLMNFFPGFSSGMNGSLHTGAVFTPGDWYLLCPCSVTVGSCTIILDYRRGKKIEPEVETATIAAIGRRITRKCIRVREYDGGQATWFGLLLYRSLAVTLSVKHSSGSVGNPSVMLIQCGNEVEMGEGGNISADEGTATASPVDIS